jgi:hypothetical protein
LKISIFGFAFHLALRLHFLLPITSQSLPAYTTGIRKRRCALEQDKLIALLMLKSKIPSNDLVDRDMFTVASRHFHCRCYFDENVALQHIGSDRFFNNSKNPKLGFQKLVI